MTPPMTNLRQFLIIHKSVILVISLSLESLNYEAVELKFETIFTSCLKDMVFYQIAVNNLTSILGH